MKHTTDFSMHHIQYVTLPPQPDRNTSDNLFRLLDRLEVFERDRMLLWAYLALLTPPDTRGAAVTEEEKLELRYNRFEEKFRHAAIGVLEPFLVYATVSYALACLRESGDSTGLDALCQKSQSEVKLLRKRIAEGTLLPEAGESLIGNLEEHINNLPAEVELARQRYDTFCAKVVKELLV
jgi:hypothetical protein